MVNARVWPAPAKINLFLHVTGRRKDGFHLLQTAFQFLDYCDELVFSVTGNGHIRRSNEVKGLEADDDLCVRAARLLQQESGTTLGAGIELRKRLPMGGGLGGGSSDAATTLLALNELWGLGWDRDRLARLGLQLGADVPVFVQGHAAWAEGVGEELTPVEPETGWVVVICPEINVSTARVFADPELTRNTPAITIRDLYAGRAGNDLLAVVQRLYPKVDRTLQWLSGFGPAQLTGSGGCVFLKVSDQSQGEEILNQRPSRCCGFVAQTMNRHPIQ